MPTSAGIVPQSCRTDPQPRRSEPQFDLVGMGNFLRSRHPANTPFHVSARTGIPPATVENWLLSRSGPDREHLSILLCCYGPAFLRAVLPAPPEWVNRAYEQAVEDDLRAVIARAESDLARLRSLK